MLIAYPVEAYGGSVCVTDDPDTARERMKYGPVVGYVGEDLDKLDGWSGIFYLVTDLTAITPHYLEQVWCRYYQLPLVIARTQDGMIRELKEDDAAALCACYQEHGDFMADRPRGEHMLVAERLRIASYVRQVYPVRGFGMYLLEREGVFVGLAGFEMEDIMGESRVTMGYYVVPEKRRMGIAERTCRILLDYVREEYEIGTVYVKIHEKNPASMALAAKLGFVPWMPDPATSSVLLVRKTPAWR